MLHIYTDKNAIQTSKIISDYMYILTEYTAGAHAEITKVNAPLHLHCRLSLEHVDLLSVKPIALKSLISCFIM